MRMFITASWARIASSATILWIGRRRQNSIIQKPDSRSPVCTLKSPVQNATRRLFQAGNHDSRAFRSQSVLTAMSIRTVEHFRRPVRHVTPRAAGKKYRKMNDSITRKRSSPCSASTFRWIACNAIREEISRSRLPSRVARIVIPLIRMVVNSPSDQTKESAHRAITWTAGSRRSST